MICAICQPHYLPWIGYFEMIDRADLFVFLDDVQYVTREWKNRNRIRKTATGQYAKWLTVPVAKQDRSAPICDVSISTTAGDWVRRHLDALITVYKGAPFFEDHIGWIEENLSEHRVGKLADLNVHLATDICSIFGIDTELVRSSKLGIAGKREEKLRAICKELGATTYLANNATAEYVPAGYFEERQIDFQVQDYSHPVYKQLHRDQALSFVSHLSIVDLLFNAGPYALSILRLGRQSAAQKEIVEQE